MKKTSKRPMPTTRRTPTRVQAPPSRTSRLSAPVQDLDPVQEDDVAEPVAPPVSSPSTHRRRKVAPHWSHKGDAWPKAGKDSAQYDPTDPR